MLNLSRGMVVVCRPPDKLELSDCARCMLEGVAFASRICYGGSMARTYTSAHNCNSQRSRCCSKCPAMFIDSPHHDGKAHVCQLAVASGGETRKTSSGIPSSAFKQQGTNNRTLGLNLNDTMHTMRFKQPPSTSMSFLYHARQLGNSEMIYACVVITNVNQISSESIYACRILG